MDKKIEVKITERDRKLFVFLRRLKYANIKQIADYLNTSVEAARVRLSILMRTKYIDNTYYMTADRVMKRRVIYSNGIEVRKKHRIKSQRNKVRVNFITLEHHLMINDIFVYLIKNGFKEENIVTERELYRERTGILTKKRLTKVSDLVLKMDNDRLVAIEVEKTKKVKKDLISTLNNLDYNTEYYVVVYICATKAICSYVKKVAKEERKTFIETCCVEDFYKNGIESFNL